MSVTRKMSYGEQMHLSGTWCISPLRLTVHLIDAASVFGILCVAGFADVTVSMSGDLSWSRQNLLHRQAAALAGENQQQPAVSGQHLTTRDDNFRGEERGEREVERRWPAVSWRHHMRTDDNFRAEERGEREAEFRGPAVSGQHHTTRDDPFWREERGERKVERRGD